MIYRGHLTLWLCTAAVACSCQKEAPEPVPSERSAAAEQQPAGFKPQSDGELSTPVARINGEVITVGQLQDSINRQSPYVRSRYRSTEQKRQFLDNLIRFEVLAQEAAQRGLDQDPEVVQTMKSAMITKLLKDQLADGLSPDSIPEAELRAYFEANQSRFHTPEEVRVSAVIVDNKRRADEVAKLAKSHAGATHKAFRDLVTKYSVDEETKLRGGDLRYFSRDSDQVPGPVIEAAFGLAKTGDIAGPIAVGKRWYIIKQTGRHREVQKTFEQVKRHVQSELFKQKREQTRKRFVDGLRKNAKIEVFDGNLNKVRVEGKR